MLHAIIMAGGSGTRFWPESRNARPKQLLKLIGEQTMIQATVSRLGDLVPADRVLVVTNARLVDEIAAQLPQLKPESIVGEPCKRDTAPCIGLAAMLVLRNDPDATMVVMPSDHVISPDEEFQAAIQLAAGLVEASPSRIATFGILPTYPAESFGYVERGDRISVPGGFSPAVSPSIYQVKRFREKPKASVAQQFVDSGEFYWNSGIFVWKARTILAALEQHQPEMLGRLNNIAAAFGKPDYETVLAREFAAIKGVSIDFAVMEHATDVVMVEAPFTWDDVGSWGAIGRLHGGDENGNSVVGKHLGLQTTGTIVRASDGHLVVTLGLSDCIIVHTPDATLVANKHDEESIRQLVKLLEERLDGVFVILGFKSHMNRRQFHRRFTGFFAAGLLADRIVRADDVAQPATKPPMNLLAPTLGGKQFWADELFFHEWHIQRNTFTGHFRLLDGSDFRHAWGSFDECRAKLDEIRRDRNLPAMSGKAVIVLHGLFRTDSSMRHMATYLREHGKFATFNVAYPSTQGTIGDHAAVLAKLLEGLEGVEEIHFVAHSLGNLVIRHYLADHTGTEKRPDARIKRLVMLAPPNNGAQLAEALLTNQLGALVAGKSGQQIAREWNTLNEKLAVPAFEFGIIAGGRKQERGYNPLLTGDNDLIVSVETARLPGATDFTVLPVIHTTMMDNAAVQEYTLRFLEQGYFVSPEARQPIPRL